MRTISISPATQTADTYVYERVINIIVKNKVKGIPKK